MLLLHLTALLALCTARAKTTCTQNPPVFFFSVGSIAATVIRDGPFIVPGSRYSVPDDAVARSYSACFRRSFPFVLGINPVILDTRWGRVLVDTGAIDAPEFPPYDEAGFLVPNMRAVGIEPESIRHIFLTHAHVGHSTGLIDERGRKVFPNATVYVSDIEHEFWFSPNASLNGTDFHTDEAVIFNALTSLYQRNIAPYVDNLVLVEEGDEPLDGIKILLIPGHTPGHIALNVSSDGESLLLVGDAWFSKPDQLQHPEWLFGLDTGRLSAYESRIRVMEMAAEERLLVQAFHEEFPGLGYIKRDGAFFDWEPMAGSSFGNGVQVMCSAEA